MYDYDIPKNIENKKQYVLDYTREKVRDALRKESLNNSVICIKYKYVYEKVYNSYKVQCFIYCHGKAELENINFLSCVEKEVYDKFFRCFYCYNNGFEAEIVE